MINKDARRNWLRCLRQFKLGIKVRARLGVFRPICKQVALQRSKATQWDAPHWEHDRWVTFLYTCIKNEEYPPELLEAFVKTAEVTFFVPYAQPTEQKVVEVINQICTRLSRVLRTKFGVFQ